MSEYKTKSFLSFKSFLFEETQLSVKSLKPFVQKINNQFGSELVKTYNDPRKTIGVASITGKIEGGADGLKTVMKHVFGNSVTVVPLSGAIASKVSGKHDSYEVSTSIGSFYFRSIIGSKGSLTNKDLTPNKLNLNGKTLTKNNFDSMVLDGLHSYNSLPINIVDLSEQLLKLAGKPGLSIQTNKEIIDLISSISSSDLKKFGKNFGEIILAKWCLYNKPNAESIFFPKDEANPLADFVVNFNKKSPIPHLNISAKFEAGANPSLKSIIPPDSKPPEGCTKEEAEAYEAVIAVAYGSIINGILSAEQILKTPEYLALEHKLGEVTLSNISNLVQSALNKAGIDSEQWDADSNEDKQKYKKFLDELEFFYKFIPGTGSGKPNIKSIPLIASLSKGKYYHPVLYAMVVSLAHKFNNEPKYSNVLNKAASSIQAEQIYLDISNKNISIKVKEFSKSNFIFSAGSYSYNADNVRMKVKMVK